MEQPEKDVVHLRICYMGMTRTYKCSNCGYFTETSGGLDFGFVAVTKTFICLDCNEIVDVLVGQYGKVYEKDKLADLIDPEDDFLSIDDFYNCPECNSKKLKIWNKSKRPCPKCKGVMKIDPEGISTLWD